MQANASADATAENVGADAAKPEPAAEPPQSVADPDAAKNGHGRKGLNPKLRREERVHDVPEGERRCPTYKVDCVPFGDDVREQLDYVPASLFVVRHVCRKYASPFAAEPLRMATAQKGDSRHRPRRSAQLSESLTHVRQAAERIYFLGAPDCNAIEIDEANSTHASGTGGYWVNAWLWVADEEL